MSHNLLYITSLLCAYGFFKTLRPSEPYDVKYIVECKNITEEDIIHKAYPLATYTWFTTLPLVFLFAGILKYRPIIYIEIASIITLLALMIWGNGLRSLQVVEIFYGLSVSSEVAYYTYIYVTVDKVHFRKVTSFIYSATFLGNFGSALISQLLVSFNLMNYLELHYLSLAGATIALAISLLLPPVTITKNKSSQPFFTKIKFEFLLLWKDFKEAYSNSYVLKWSIWWAFEKAGNYQIVTYYKSMLHEIEPEVGQDENLNGAVQAIQCILSVLLSTVFAYLPINWSNHGQYLLSGVAIAQGLALYGFATIGTKFPTFGFLIVYRILHQVTATITSAEVAENINERSHGLVFGFNVFLAAGIQVALTLIVNTGFELLIKEQFIVYSGFNLVLGLSFFGVTIVNVILFRKPKQGALKV